MIIPSRSHKKYSKVVAKVRKRNKRFELFLIVKEIKQCNLNPFLYVNINNTQMKKQKK